MKETSWKYVILLLFASLIWGSAFVAQSVGMDYVGPFTFNAVRSLIGSLSLFPCILIMDHVRGRTNGEKAATAPEEKKTSRKRLVFSSLICGIFLCGATMFQQYGLLYTTVSKGGFITAMYIVLVPVLGIFIGKKVTKRIWGCVVAAVVGLYLLCITDGFSIQLGDLLMLICALLFAVHILVIDHVSPGLDSLKLSCGQFFVSGMISAVFMLILEEPRLSEILAAWLPILYAGVLSCGVAYTIQVIAQKRVEPTIASLAMSMESVFSVLSAWVILGQSLTLREAAGCVIMFAAIIVSQLPGRQQA